MKQIQIGVVLLLVITLIVGFAGADTPVTVGGGWVNYYVAAGMPPVPSDGNPFTFSSEVPTHITITDGGCVGDVPQIYDFDALVGTGSSVTSEHPDCANPVWRDDALADGRFSHGCFNLEAGRHALSIQNIQMYSEHHGDGGDFRVDEGYCDAVPSPEFPSIFLPALFVIGFLGAVMLIQRSREH